MHTLTLLELLVQWESIAPEDFILVWVTTAKQVHDETYWSTDAMIWHRDCCVSGPDMHGISVAIRRSEALRCEILENPLKHYNFDDTYPCGACGRSIEYHLT